MTTNEPNDPEQYDDYSVDDETQLQPEDTLADDDVADELDRGYSPPEKYSAGQRYGNTPWEQAHPQPLDDRLAEEEPEVDPAADPTGPEDPDAEVGGERAGRLVDPDEGLGDDLEKDLVAEDVGIDGAGASAEEAAMHVIDDEDSSGGQNG
ncbi:MULTISPECIES: DUF5709 domain-containing protein [unclassified Nocardioides]|uniref:DUF5709 domain-containing protein n=1 Tax=unclassified Nocardioides TaxID=2615069 RepID=UPI001151879E|nr:MULTISPECIES: DUF5709 domain-containing protein [unclassified Nocardioides]WGY03174.1 DUF5709 domain-containing protein [Nocardioides sp. QY071]